MLIIILYNICTSLKLINEIKNTVADIISDSDNKLFIHMIKIETCIITVIILFMNNILIRSNLK